jgi:hypothetical protein
MLDGLPGGPLLLEKQLASQQNWYFRSYHITDGNDSDARTLMIMFR